MTKQDWIEVINASGGRDWLDILVIAVSIISPILVFFSVRYAAKSAKAAEKAANLNLKMHEEQKKDHEKSFLPLFAADGWVFDDSKTLIHFVLTNKNETPISFIKTDSLIEEFEYLYIKHEDQLNYTIHQNFNEKDTATFNVYYDALNHHRYKSEIEVILINSEVFVNKQKNFKEY